MVQQLGLCVTFSIVFIFTVRACAEHCCTHHHQHLEVWLQPGSDTAQWTSLARCPRPGVIQAGSDSSPVSDWQRTTVPIGLLHPSCQCWHSLASVACAFSQPPATHSTAFPAQHLQPSGLFNCCRHGLVLSRIRDSAVCADCFRCLLKTNLFAWY